MFAVQRYDNAKPWLSRPPVLKSDASIEADWTDKPNKVWTFEEGSPDAPEPEMLAALGAEIVHWGSVPRAKKRDRAKEQSDALDALIEKRARQGDATARAAKEARKGHRR